MADGFFNIAKGKWAQWITDDPTLVTVLLLKANEADSVLSDYDDVAALLAASGNTEADATNYARKTGVTATLSLDDANDEITVSIPDQTWTNLGGAVNNTLTKVIIAYQSGTGDAGLVPISHHDFSHTTDGNDVTAKIGTSGFGKAV